jgi:hypothetical protein
LSYDLDENLKPEKISTMPERFCIEDFLLKGSNFLYIYKFNDKTLNMSQEFIDLSENT